VNWVLAGLGPVAGFVNAWASIAVQLLNMPLYPVLIANSIGQVVDLSDGATWGIKLAAVTFAFAANVVGIEAIGNITGIMVVLVQTPFLLMPIVWAARGFPFDWGVLTTWNAGWFDNLAVFIATIAWNQQGWPALASIAGEVKSPARSLPRGILLAVLGSVSA
jgi:amino acid transporter